MRCAGFLQLARGCADRRRCPQICRQNCQRCHSLIGSCDVYRLRGSLGLTLRSQRSSRQTCAAATIGGQSENSDGAWLIPPLLGTNIRAEGQTDCIVWASCPAPDGISICCSPSRSATAETRRRNSVSSPTGSSQLRSAIVTLSPWRRAASRTIPSNACFRARMTSRSVSRITTENSARPGTVWTSLGEISTRPIVMRDWSVPHLSTKPDIPAATSARPENASARRCIGVVPE